MNFSSPQPTLRFSGSEHDKRHVGYKRLLKNHTTMKRFAHVPNNLSRTQRQQSYLGRANEPVMVKAASDFASVSCG
jgi:hypothetical protein